MAVGFARRLMRLDPNGGPLGATHRLRAPLDPLGDLGCSRRRCRNAVLISYDDEGLFRLEGVH